MPQKTKMSDNEIHQVLDQFGKSPAGSTSFSRKSDSFAVSSKGMIFIVLMVLTESDRQETWLGYKQDELLIRYVSCSSCVYVVLNMGHGLEGSLRPVYVT